MVKTTVSLSLASSRLRQLYRPPSCLRTRASSRWLVATPPRPSTPWMTKTPLLTSFWSGREELRYHLMVVSTSALHLSTTLEPARTRLLRDIGSTISTGTATTRTLLGLYPVYMMKQTWSKLRAYVVHVYFEYVCFIFASSCKRGITVIIGGPLASNKEHSGINDCLEDNREKRIIRTAITVTYAHPLQFLQFQAWVDFFGERGVL